jgi:Domain of unknown function (DUF4397)
MTKGLPPCWQAKKRGTMTSQGPVRRITRLLAVSALSLGLLAAAAPAAMASPAKASVGWLRLAHLSPNAPAVDVYLYSLGKTDAIIVLHHVAYGTVSGYETVPAGEYTVAMRLAGKPANSTPVLTTSVSVSAGHAYTVAGMGPAAGLRLQVMDDTLKTPKGKSLVRVIQASLKDHKVTVTAGGQTLVKDLAFGKLTPYTTVAPGSFDVHVVGGTMSASKSFTLAADTTHTLVVLDDPGHLGLIDLTDAAGSKLMPKGAAATGFGGMAPRPASSSLPWVAAMAFGALVAAGGTLRLRSVRTRRRPMWAHGSHAR